MSSQFFLFFNFSFSAFFPMGLSKVSLEFISSLFSSRFIELAKVWQDCVASYLVRAFKLSLRINHLASFLKILQQCSNWNAFLLLLWYIAFASLIYKSKKLKIMRIIKVKVYWCTIHIRCWVEIPCYAQFYHFHFGPSIHKTCWSPFELLTTDYIKNPWSG